jgi:hypothetical protein
MKNALLCRSEVAGISVAMTNYLVDSYLFGFAYVKNCGNKVSVPRAEYPGFYP